jgi:single stranded DNA-binding protein
MSVNKVIVIGNLGRDPEVRAQPSGQNVANLSLATTAQFKDRNGEQQKRTEWHRVVAFGKLADNCQRFLSKGRQIYVEGRLTTCQYEAKDGSGKRPVPRSWRFRCACSAIARIAARPRRKRPTTFRSDRLYPERAA